ncbi:MAG: (d)CMP kinase [Erysipelotrichaceae bacterium]|nr:(d)CMP kinase [Erysipelotrichaceae bacterium]
MFKIAIDGPAGAGKSTIAKILAKKLNIEYIDTGAMYRAVTLKALRLGIDMEDENAYGFLSSTVLDICNGRFIMDGEDVSEAIRTVEVTENVSTPSKIGVVRSYLVDYQRKISDSKSVIMDGRDIGTVVLPNAELKIYLIASVECRAKRRMLEREQSGIFKSLEETMLEIETRDHKDSTRKISPLKCAEDAIVVDSSDMTIDEVVSEIIKLVNERGLIKMSEKNEKYYVGQTVTGTVTGVNSNAIYLEIEEGVKAVIYANDLLEVPGKLYLEYSEGAEYTAQVKSIGKDKKNPNVVVLYLSTKLAYEKEQAEAKEKALQEKIAQFHAIKEADEVINAKVLRTTKNGAELLYNNTKLFLSYKHSSLSEDALKQLKGEEIPVIVLYVNEERHFISVSQIAAEKKQKRLAKEAAYGALEVGQVVEGEVVSILAYGAIVKLGLVSGLLHASEIDHFPVRDVKKVLSVGKKVTVKVIKIDEEKIGLSMKALTTHPWEVLKEKYHVGDVFEGTVKKIIPAGLIIELTPEYSGLMSKMEYSWLVNEKYDGVVNEGDKILVKVMNIDDKKFRVSLSHRETVENAWSGIKLRKGEIVEVEVVRDVERGAEVTYKTVTGFLPVNEVSSSKRVTNVTDEFAAGTKVNAMVLECDPNRAKLVVSVKAIEVAKERESFDSYMKEQEQENTGSTIGDLLGDALKK